MIQMTYQKRNGEVIQRIRNTYCTYRIGDTTSMGWKVLDIKYNWGGKYYHKTEYDRIIEKEIQKDKKRIKLKKRIVSIYKNLAYAMSLLILMRAYEWISKPIA